MTKEEAIEYIKSNPEIYFKRAKTGYVCPICQNGTGEDGTGIKENPKNKGHFKCFKCDENGDVLHFIGKQYRLNSFPDILEKAYSIYGITLNDKEYKKEGNKDKMKEPTQEPEENQTSERQENFRDFFKQANENLNKNYTLNKTSYLLKRGISIETQNKFKIGYVEKWVSPTAQKKGNKSSPSPRIIIPTSDSSYVARDVRPDVKEYKAIKEGKMHLFNLYALSIPIVKKEDATGGKAEGLVSNDNVEPIFIVEGEIDALSIIEAGGEAIGLGGTSNINSLINELEKRGEEARKRPYIICLDNDEAGKEASKKLQEELKHKGFIFTDKCEKILKTYKDPNEALVGNREGFIVTIKEIKSTSLEMLEEEKENYIQEYKDKIANVLISFDTEKKTIKTRLKDLDDFLDGGLHAGLYVLAAASGTGKTTFALQVADNIAKTKQDVLFFSGEMTIHEIVAKSLSRMSKETAKGNNRNALTMRTILNVKATNNSEYKARLTTLASQDYPDIAEHVRIYDGLQEIKNIEDKIAEHKRITGNIPVIFIDYLQIIKNKDASSKEKRLQVDEIVSQLRIIAAKYETPVFVISSLNRTAYGRVKAGQNPEPSDEKDIYMADLKESGGIEYGADVIMTLKTSKDDDNGNVRGVKVKIIKNRTGKRHGKGEAIKFKFHAMFNYFEDDGVLENKNKPSAKKNDKSDNSEKGYLIPNK
jgi:replicative DNA helicase